MDSVKKMLKCIGDEPINLIVIVAILIVIVFFVYPYVKSFFVEGMDTMDDDDEEDDDTDDDTDNDTDNGDDEQDGVASEGFGNLGSFKFGEGFVRGKRKFRGIGKVRKQAAKSKEAAKKARKDGYRKYM